MKANLLSKNGITSIKIKTFAHILYMGFWEWVRRQRRGIGATNCALTTLPETSSAIQVYPSPPVHRDLGNLAVIFTILRFEAAALPTPHYELPFQALAAANSASSFSGLLVRRAWLVGKKWY
jgi:hypothetical protein